jgi:predicted DNA-binding transcriptional regulator AlpA
MRTSEFRAQLLASEAPPGTPARSPETEVFVPYGALAEHGIGYCRVHLRRLVSRGLFPRPVMLSANRIAWRLSDLAAWKASRPTAA